MSTIDFNIATNLKSLNRIIKEYPKAQVSTLSDIAKRGRSVLRKDLLSGQALNLKSGDKDVKGRNLISGRVTKNFTITFSSYPVNLFERGRLLRSGQREPGRWIITKKFKSLMKIRLQGMANDAFDKTLKKWLRE